MNFTKALLLCASFQSFFFLTVGSVHGQTLRQIGITRQSARVPQLVITSSSVSLNSNNALVQTTAGLEKQKVEIAVPGSPKTVIETYAEASVDEITLFDPSTYAEASANTGVRSQDNNKLPFICGASSPTNAPNLQGGSVSDGVETLQTGPGLAPSIFTGAIDNSRTTDGSRTNDPNPLAATVLGAGTNYARNPYSSSGSDGENSATLGPQQIVSPNLNISVQGVVLHSSPSVLTSCGTALNDS
jgi:hypothetical protein